MNNFLRRKSVSIHLLNCHFLESRPFLKLKVESKDSATQYKISMNFSNGKFSNIFFVSFSIFLSIESLVHITNFDRWMRNSFLLLACGSTFRWKILDSIPLEWQLQIYFWNLSLNIIWHLWINQCTQCCGSIYSPLTCSWHSNSRILQFKVLHKSQKAF